MNMTEQQVLEALREVVDPEMGLDIVALGLIYDVRLDPARVAVKMTLTMRGCPMHDSITSAVRAVLLNLPGVGEADVEIVWDPPWSPAMMAPEAQGRLA
ncbi:MAG: metal-sulfur cluster assembly factor [Verrucomicrobia bacterium]|jgi:metal-sulfur cluster biosynthetic enzyme|nr:metal-sulfur cluster assembly factor [Verrucomicrobiota bacterium]